MAVNLGKTDDICSSSLNLGLEFCGKVLRGMWFIRLHSIKPKSDA